MNRNITKFELARQIFELEVSTLKIEYQFGLSNIYNKFPIVENKMNRIIRGMEKLVNIT